MPSSTEPTTSTTRPFPTTQEGLQREMLEVFMARNPVLVEGEAQTREIDCESKALVIKTTLSWVSTKHCWPILVHGSKNNVIIDLLGGTAPGLWITGDDNVVRYASGSCCIAIAGQRTRVVRGG